MPSKESPMKELHEMRPRAGLSSRSNSKARVLLSSENKKEVLEGGEASFRVYYGATGAAVPFMWESQPGTPKHPIFDKSSDNIVPPLTPPPSYKSSPVTTSSYFSSAGSRARKPWILSTLFSSISISGSRKRSSMSHVIPTSSLTMSSSSSSSYSGHIRSWSTSSSSSSSASLSTPHLAGREKHVYHKRSASSLCFYTHKSPHLEEDDRLAGSRSSPSTMCFGFNKKQGKAFDLVVFLLPHLEF
ncbi:hypothetical protein Cgig2_027984 [Carnegiea gigantea]|uniref:Uncharacterized protein n=1 Tax=Carnegiea gigantea TaxID=171969 RepID=A0A9Q1GYC6_9CARY|nr:hypothetical protein Cgig2_027984 [Carnegiea gigantea]